MATKISQLAKLTRPRLHKAVARERLFAVLDEARTDKSAICVVGPPGAGKTTLVASWLDSRAIKGIWYQVDQGDADLATFFYYLGEAVKPFTAKGQRPLPHLTTEYLADVTGFGRRYMRELFSRLPEGSVLVLDNYQEAETAQLLHEIVAAVIDEVPQADALVVISRRDPPNCYARFIANNNVGFIEWEDLKYTVAEVQQVARARGTLLQPAISERLHAASDGWAAGLTLLLEDLRRAGNTDSSAPVGHDAIFGYFAGNVFEKLPQTIQRFLMATACMPQVPVSVAHALTERSDAGQILEDLYRRHLFTHRRPAREETYWYHALFRSFLLEQSRKRLDAKERNVIQRRAAELLDRGGYHEDAFGLYCDIKEWVAAEKLLLCQAARLLEQGRDQTLREWLATLPVNRLELQPLLRYWLGMALISTSLEKARQHLERAFDTFRQSGDITWQIHAAAGIVDTWYYAWERFQPMTHWARQMGELMELKPKFDSVQAELHVYSSWLLSMLFGDPGHPSLRSCVDRVDAMLDEDLDSNSKVVAGAFLMVYCVLSTELQKAAEVMAKITPLLCDESLSPLNEIWWRVREGWYLLLIGRYEEGNWALARAETLASVHGLDALGSASLLICSYQVKGACYLHDPALAQIQLTKMERLARPNIPSSQWLIHSGRADYAYLTHDHEQVRAIAPAMITAAEQTGMRYIEILGLLNTAAALSDLGLVGELEEKLCRLRKLSVGTCFSYIEPEVRLLDSWAHFRESGSDAALRKLGAAIAYARECRYPYGNIFRFSRALAGILSEALRTNAEVLYVRELIAKFRIRPPSSLIEIWPWPVKVYMLGRFELWRNDERVEFSGKTPKKPLALLKALTAFGGSSVPEERVMDALWPDEEADAARKSLDVTVLRLRKLLGSNATILVSDELISLNPQLCWSDVCAFEQRIKESETNLGSPAEALVLYRGNFLPAEIDEPWTVKSRERLRARFVRLVEATAEADEAAGRWDKAITLYLRGLEADDLVEAFHLGLMRCYRALERPAEALTAFRRLRQTLSVVLGIAPSPDAEKMARDLKAHNPRVAPE
jgi:LuxR family maltose regulon positive regulatory protein